MPPCQRANQPDRVDQAARDLGATVARLLGERMDGRSRSVLSSAAPRLIVRNTTGPPPN
jgi:LacI family transcriptional regulator